MLQFKYSSTTLFEGLQQQSTAERRHMACNAFADNDIYW
jgi:hypothetical protein